MENQIKYTKTPADFLAEDKSQYPNTFNELLEYCAQKFANQPFVGKVSERPYTFKDFYARVLSISTLLVERGIKKSDRVAILGENSPNWGISYFAIMRAGAAAVPILPDFPEADIRHILSDSETKALFITYKQWEKICGPDLDRLCSRIHLKHIIMLDDFDDRVHQIKMESLTDIFNKALDFIKKIPGTFGLGSHRVSEDDIASLIYTSGTSGHSKAVMLTHKNLISNAIALSKLAKVTGEDVCVSILPLSHSYEFTVGFLLMLISGCRVVYLGKPPTPSLLEKACAAEKPTLMCAVPLILEKIYKKKVLPVLEKNLAVKFITKIPLLKKKIYKKINKKLIHFFGGRLRLLAIGGAAFNVEAEKFFRLAGFPYLVGYGLTETSPYWPADPKGIEP